MITQAAIDPQLISQNYELFRNCLYWNCDHRHPMFKAERHRNNGEGERYITIEVDKIRM
jgi:hypothetical protein